MKKGYCFLDDFARGSFDVPVRDLVTFTASTLPVWNGKLDILLDDLSPLVQKDSTVVVMGGTEKAAKTLLRISKTRMFRHFIFRSSCRISAWQSFGFARRALGRLRLSARKILCLYLWQKRRCVQKKKSRSGFKRDRASTRLMSLKRATTLFIRSTV